MTAVIVCGGNIENYVFYKKYFDDADLIVCADGGARHLTRAGIMPHVVLGDFDSISREDLSLYQNKGIKIFQYDAEKDMTDTELAIEYVIEEGYKRVILIGAVGTRLDHSLSNIFHLKKMLDRNVEGIIVDEYNEIRLINDRITMEKEDNAVVSLMALTQAVRGVTTHGFKYPLYQATIQLGSSLGISNEFVCQEAQVEITDGLLLVIKSKEK